MFSYYLNVECMEIAMGILTLLKKYPPAPLLIEDLKYDV